MESIWNGEVWIPPRKPLKENISVETVIIGAGMAGVLTAYELRRRGKPCVILEAKRIGSGQTGNTTAKITSQHGMCYENMIQKSGIVKARQYAKANEEAIQAYEQIIEEGNIDCEFQRCPAYLYSQVERECLQQEAEAARQAGIDAEFTTKTALPFPVEGAVKFRGQAQFHPLKFLKAVSEELDIYEQTKVFKVEGNVLQTTGGTVEAGNIIFACHFPFVNIPGYYFARMHQERSYVVAVKQAQQLDGMYYGIDEEGLSFRNAGKLLLAGGGQHRTGENQEGGRYEKLWEQIRQYWSGCKKAACWSAQDCMTLDGIPYIGRFSGETEHWYVATGFGKWGMSSSMVSAHLLADLIIHQISPYEELFSPQRSITAEAVGNFLEDGMLSAKNLGKGLLDYQEKKRCTHLGCELEWNPDEEVYECLCHGSRFDRNGKLLNNPALEDLSLKSSV